MVTLLDLPFHTRQELQHHSFILGTDQIHEAAIDLEGVIQSIGSTTRG